MKPKLFVGSAGDSFTIARRVTEILNQLGRVEARHWKDKFFAPAKTFVVSLEQILKCQFGVFVFSADDKVTSRKKQSTAPRDNVIFEAGMFAGKRGFDRLFVLQQEKTKLPSDLSGFNTLPFKRSKKTLKVLEDKTLSDKVLEDSLQTACANIHGQMMNDWQRSPIAQATRDIISNLLECSSRLATLGTNLKVGEIRCFCHLHDGEKHLLPIASFTGNRHDKDEGLHILCDPAQPESEWYVISQAYLKDEFTLRNVNWTKARRENSPGAKNVRMHLAGVAAQPILMDEHPCGTISFDSLKKVSEIGWNDLEEKERLRVILREIADIVSSLIR